MRVIKFVRYMRPEDLGSDNTPLIDPELGTYLIKDANFRTRPIGTEIEVYPVIRNRVTGYVSVFTAILTTQDYENTIRMPRES